MTFPFPQREVRLLQDAEGCAAAIAEEKTERQDPP